MKKTLLAALVAVWAVVPLAAQDIVREYESDDPAYYMDRPRADRYLDVEVWTDHADGEYYIGDNVSIHFRANRDCFIAIYTIDTRGRVNLLFPTSPNEDNFVLGNETYRLPGAGDNYDLVISGPEGMENIQVIASRDRFPIPSWYHNSGLIADWEDRFAYMDYLNGKYFVRYEGQRFAYDRAVVFVNEWEPYYYRPVYYPTYPHWTVAGNIYLDYGWGYSVYVNGVYWGCTPLYIPRIAVGWHTFTVYDPWGFCWENDVHISYYNTVVLNKTVIKTQPSVKSKYRTVRASGYVDPAQNGYPEFAKVKSKADYPSGRVSKNAGTKSTRASTDAQVISKPGKSTMKYARGSTKLVKTDRGFEIDHSIKSSKQQSKYGDAATRARTDHGKTSRITGGSNDATSRGYTRGKATNSRGDASARSRSTTKRSPTDYYQRKSATRKSTGSDYYRKGTNNSGKESSGNYRKSVRSKSSDQTPTYRKSSPSKNSSGNVGKSAPKKSGSGNVSKRSSGSSSGGARKSGGSSSKSSSSKSGGKSKR